MTSSPPLVLLLLLAPLLPANLIVLADISTAYHNYLDSPTTCGVAPLNSRQNERCIEVSRSAPYIDNGNNVEDGQWPFLAWVHVNGSGCSGVIVSREVVITAGHCVDGLEQEYLGGTKELGKNVLAFVQVGKIKRFDIGTFEADYDIKRVQMGAHYKRRGFKGNDPDFARLWLREQIDYNDYVQPACIPSKPEMVYRLVAGPLFFIGTGVKYEHLEFPVYNQKAQWIQMKAPDSTSRKLRMKDRDNLTEYVFVSQDESSRKLCYGDSGGPLVALDENSRWSLVGIGVASTAICKPDDKYGETDYFTLMANILDIFDKNFNPGPD